MVRDELDLHEWIAYQFAIGVEHVHLFDNESVTPVAKRFRAWINDGKVSVESIRGRKVQSRAYQRYVEARFSKWVAFVDADEFILPYDTDDVKEILCEFEDYGGLVVSWQVFGSNGYIARPGGLVIESYTKTGTNDFDLVNHLSDRRPVCHQYKTIAQPEFIKRVVTPHYFTYRSGRSAVKTNGALVSPTMLTVPCVERIAINHYMNKSAEDFRLKQERRGGESGKPRTEAAWLDIENGSNQIEDTRILRFVPEVKKWLGSQGVMCP